MNEIFTVITAPGLEQATMAELTLMGIRQVKEHRGAVSFEGDKEALYKAHLMLRTPTRILRPMEEFAAHHSRMLYDQVRRIKWEAWLKPTHTLAVDVTFYGAQASEGQAGELRNSHFAALKIKDAIVDRMMEETGQRPNIDKERPHLRLHALFHRGRCKLSLDATGHSLHERGYRAAGTEAPLKETLAAALVDFTGWTAKTPLLDPMCGSGTLLIEAARKALGIAPGLDAKGFSFQNWPDYDAKLWNKLCNETIQTQEKTTAAVGSLLKIFGSDISGSAVRLAREQSENADVADFIQLQSHDVLELEAPCKEPGIMLTNPPFGERIGDKEKLPEFYRAFSHVLKTKFQGWTLYLLSGDPELTRHLGFKAAKKWAVKNGPIECRLLKYELF